MRRLQSYRDAANSARVPDNYHSRAALWNAILRAPGFLGGLSDGGPHQHPEVPLLLPLHPPSAQVIQWIYDDFHHNYRCFEQYQWRKRRESCRAKLLSTSKGLYAITRKTAKYALDCLEDTASQPITVLDSATGLISVPTPFPDNNVISWSLQSQPACVKVVEDRYQVNSDMLLVTGQMIACTTLVHEPAEIHLRLSQLWTPRWTKHANVPHSQWDQIKAFAAAHLPRGQISLPPLSISDWRRAAHSFKTNAATGPCGWSRADMLNMADHHVQAVLDLFTALESGAAWPQQLSVGLIHCLQKSEDNVTANGFRPITVMSMWYRVYASLRSGQILAQLATWSDFMQCGFLKKRQSSDVWYFVGICLEVSF